MSAEPWSTGWPMSNKRSANRSEMKVLWVCGEGLRRRGHLRSHIVAEFLQHAHLTAADCHISYKSKLVTASGMQDSACSIRHLQPSFARRIRSLDSRSDPAAVSPLLTNSHADGSTRLDEAQRPQSQIATGRAAVRDVSL